MGIKISHRGKYLSDFPNIIKHLDMSKHKDINPSTIQAGSNKVVLNWICEHCKESYERNINHKVQGVCCPKSECMLLKRSKTNNEQFGWLPKYHIPKRVVTKKPDIPEPSKNDMEEWKELPNELLLSKYEVSSLGNIRSKKDGYVLSIKPRKDGYVCNRLILDSGKGRSVCTHILVAKAFIPNPDNKPTVNHINMKKNDNRVINLEWATYSEQSFKENRRAYRTIGKGVDQFDLNGKFIKTWNKAIDAEQELNISRKNILKVLKGEREQSGGFKWKYAINDTSIEGEVWKECPLGNDYDKVMVSSLGRIRKNGYPSYGVLRDSGYYDTQVYNKTEKKYKSFRVHRLICFGFIENKENKPFVNHIDNNRSNNKVENLEWVTNRENVIHSLQNHNRPRAKYKSKAVIQIDLHTNTPIREFPSQITASKETKISLSWLSHCCKNKHKSAGGYKWRYKD